MEDLKEYVVIITETLTKEVIIKAYNSLDARATIIEEYNSEEIILNSENIKEISFKVKEN